LPIKVSKNKSNSSLFQSRRRQHCSVRIPTVAWCEDLWRSRAEYTLAPAGLGWDHAMVYSLHPKLQGILRILKSQRISSLTKFILIR
jgi:hypothetical protein